MEISSQKKFVERIKGWSKQKEEISLQKKGSEFFKKEGYFRSSKGKILWCKNLKKMEYILLTLNLLRTRCVVEKKKHKILQVNKA